MRTNTWLAIQVVQAELNHFALRSQLNRIDAGQARRDQIRDEKFDRAAAIAQRGQFAMWLQSPEGQIFDRWTTHATTASQQLEDRQAAWELAWFAEHLAALSSAPHNDPPPFGTTRPWDDFPWHSHLQGPQVPAVAQQIDDFAARASETLPRPSELPPLAGLYFSYPVQDAEQQHPLPPAVRELLEAFHTDDVQRVAALHADGFC